MERSEEMSGCPELLKLWESGTEDDQCSLIKCGAKGLEEKRKF